jgi:putative zinc finger protein
MTDQWTNRLSEYLDGDLAANDRAALEAHLAGCAACRATLAELERVVARAQALEDRPPANELWSGIAERIGVSAGPGVVRLADRRERHARRRMVFSIPQAIAAGVTLMLLSGGAAWLALRSAPTEIVVEGEGRTDGPNVRTATMNYDLAVADLERTLDAGRDRLDSATVRVLEENLALIDRAIAQARRALDADPANAYLNHHLADTMRRKLQLLRRANSIASAQS